MKTTILPLKHSVNRAYRPLTLMLPLVLACFALSPQARATCQEGCDTVNFNTFLGDGALISNTSGFDNTAVGYQALYGNINGLQNTASGVYSLTANTSGGGNTAQGAFALQANTTGNDNTADGSGTLVSNTTGIWNTAVGSDALSSNTTGDLNTALGFQALQLNTTGGGNVAVGGALKSNTTGGANVAVGGNALASNTTGFYNIALGVNAGVFLTTGNNNIAIANYGMGGQSRTIWIGTNGTHRTVFMAGISGATVPTGVPVIVDTTGHLGTTTSSARFKEAIKPMAKASETLYSLEPVTFRYKKELDPENILQFGLVAEDVEKVNPDLVARDEQGKPYTVRYEAVNAMLLNEFLKAHQKIEVQESEIAELKSALNEMNVRLTAKGL
jgi:hypothetical protein